MILRPEGGPRNHWISFALQGTKSNRLALNARVSVTLVSWSRRTKCAVAGAICRRTIFACTLVWEARTRRQSRNFVALRNEGSSLAGVIRPLLHSARRKGYCLAPSLPVPVQCLIVDDRRILREHGRVQRGLSLRRPVSSGFRRNGNCHGVTRLFKPGLFFAWALSLCSTLR